MSRVVASTLAMAAAMVNGTLAISLDTNALARVGLAGSAALLIFIAFKNLTVVRTQEGITQ